MAGGGNAHAAAGYFQLALDRNAMSHRGRNRQRARAVNRQGILGEHRCVNVVIVNRLKRIAAGKVVLRARRQRQKHLIGLAYIDRSGGFAMNGHAIKHQLHLGVLGRVHNDLPILQRTRQHVNALCRNRCGRTADGHALRACGNFAIKQLNHRRLVRIVILRQIPRGKIVFLLRQRGAERQKCQRQHQANEFFQLHHFFFLLF